MELDYRDLNSPLPILRFKKQRANKDFPRNEEIKILLVCDIEENQREFEVINRQMDLGYIFERTEYGCLYTQRKE